MREPGEEKSKLQLQVDAYRAELQDRLSGIDSFIDREELLRKREENLSVRQREKSTPYRDLLLGVVREERTRLGEEISVNPHRSSMTGQHTLSSAQSPEDQIGDM